MPKTAAGIYYEINGKGSPLIVAHGAWKNSTEWNKQKKLFSIKNTIITYDLREHGKSQINQTYRINLNHSPAFYSASLLMQDLDSIVDIAIDSTGVKPVICGNSLNTLLFKKYAVLYSHKLSGLILSNPIPFNPKYRIAAKLIGRPSIVYPSFKLFEKDIPLFTQGITMLTASIVKGCSFKEAKENGRYEVKGKAKETMYVASFLASYIQPRLNRIKIPTRIILGENSKKTRPYARDLKRKIKNSDLVMISNSSHTPHLENPKAFYNAVYDFLKEIPWKMEKEKNEGSYYQK